MRRSACSRHSLRGRRCAEVNDSTEPALAAAATATADGESGVVGVVVVPLWCCQLIRNLVASWSRA